MTDTLARYRRRATEAEMRQTIIDCVEHLGGRVFWIQDSRGIPVENLPDLVIVCGTTVALIELKSQFRNLTPGQAHVLNLLADASRVVSGVVRPSPRPGEMSLDDCLRMLQEGGTTP